MNPVNLSKNENNPKVKLDKKFGPPGSGPPPRSGSGFSGGFSGGMLGRPQKALLLTLSL